MKTSQLYFFISLLLTVLLTSCSSGNSEKKNNIETKKVTVEDVEKGIRANIAKRTKQGGGYFTFTSDSVELSLKLVRVHTEYLSVLGPNKFFACVDLATENGDVYDVDFFMQGSPDAMELTRTNVHKLNGKPFYTWKQAKDKTWYTVPVKKAGNELLGVIEDKDRFTFTYGVILPEIDGTARIWIPLATSDKFQDIEQVSLATVGEKEIITDLDHNNSILYLELGPEHSNDKIEILYNVIRKEKSPYSPSTIDTLRYLGSSSLLPVNDRFIKLSDSIIKTRQATTPLTKARALYDYVIDNVRYAKQGKYGTGDATYACDSKSGNCTEFHSLFISLARSSGIPARFAVGAAIPSERNEGGVNGYHCWAEFYAEGKWWPIDISEANKYSALATYYFGHHPANRIEFSKGRDLTPEPGPMSGPINFLAYPVLEIEGQTVKVDTKFTFDRQAESI